MEKAPDIMNLNELHVYTGISKSWLYRLTSTGIIKSYKPSGKLMFFRKEDVDKFLLSNKEAFNPCTNKKEVAA